MITDAANDAYCALEVHDILENIAIKNDIIFDASSITKFVPRATPLGPTSSNVSLQSATSFTSTNSSTTTLTEAPTLDIPPRRPTRQQLRAYTLWHHMKMPLSDMCKLLRSDDDPLKPSTVMYVARRTAASPCFYSWCNSGYVVEALKADKTLPFDKDAILELLANEQAMIKRYERWIANLE